MFSAINVNPRKLQSNGKQWLAPGIFIGGLEPRRFGGPSPPVQSRDEALVEVWGEVPQKLKHFADFDSRNDQNLKILHNSPPDS